MKRFLFLLIILIAACKKVDLPPVDNGDPVFTLSANADGTSLELIAGEEDYYMFTSYERDSLDVLNMIGELRPENCPDCGPYLKLTFREKVASTPSSFNIQTALPTGAYSLEEVAPTEEYHYMLQLSAEPSIYQEDELILYRWNVNGETSLEPNPLIELPNFTQPVNVLLENTTLQGGNCSIEKTIGFTAISFDCGVDFDFEIWQGGFLNRVTAIPYGTSPFTYAWNTGENTSSVATENPQDSAFAQVCVTVTDANGCETTSCPAVKIFGNPVSGLVQYYSYTDFSYQTYTDTVLIGDPFAYGLATIEYGDELGNVYRSDWGAQDASSFFDLLSIEDYDDNENGEKTRKFDFKTTAVLYDSSGGALPFSTELSTFAIAYPE